MKLSEAVFGFRIDRLASGYSPHTLDGYHFAFKKLINYLNDPELQTVTPADIKNFYFHLRTTTELAPASHKAIWRAVRSFYNWASEEFKLVRPDTQPAPFTQSKEIIPFTEDEVKRIIRACEVTATSKTARRTTFTMKRPTSLRDKALVTVLLDTGMRVSECARLTLRDINLESGEVHIHPYLSGRKSRPRTVYLGKASRRATWRYLATRSEATQSEGVFLSNGTSMNRDSIYNLVAGLGERADVPGCHPHRFRHTFAIQYLRNGGDVFTLQRLLGHSSLEMVRKYLKLADSDAEDAHRRASPADCWRL